MPSQLIDNTKISFVCLRNFTYNGEEFKQGEDFPQEKARDIDTMVRTRYVAPVVKRAKDKPRHWHHHVQVKSELLARLGKEVVQMNLDRPEDVNPEDFHSSPDETEDNARALWHKQQDAIDAYREKNVEDEERLGAKQEIQIVDGKEESEPPELVGPGEHEAKVVEVEEAQPDLYDPADYNAPDVLAYLSNENTSAEEKRRVLEAERNGKNRKGIVGDAGE